MAQYHVGCGIAGIYAGTLKKGENAFAYAFKMRDGKYVRLKIESADECPDWAKGKFHED